MKMLRHTLVWLVSLGLAASSGGGGSEGTSPFGGGSGTTPPASSATAVDVISSGVEIGSGGDEVTISAIVKGSGNVALAGAPVTFATDSGALTSVSTVADKTGVATATLAAGANKSNRNITVTATSGGVTGTIVIPVVGTKLTYVGVTTLTLASTSSIGVTAVDSKGAVIAGLAVTVSSSLNNHLSASSITTDAQGAATLTYTATNAGSDNVKFDGGGASVTQSIQVSAVALAFISPVAGTKIPVGTSSPVTLQYLSNGAPVANASILFAITGGSVTTSTLGTAASTCVLTTDASGRGTEPLIYAASYVPWVEVKLRAEAVVAGTESFKEAIFFVLGSTEDFSSATTPPAESVSPVGVNACNISS